MKKMLISLLAISLILMTTHIGFAGEPGTPGESIVGPTMDGVVWITLLSVGTENVFLGNCNGKPFVINIGLESGLPTKADDMLYYRISSAGPAGCRTADGGEDLIITAVKNFGNDGLRVLADVDLKFILNK